jgi:DNA-binding XRE family transcriptional regulator
LTGQRARRNILSVKLNDYLSIKGVAPTTFAALIDVNLSTLWRIRTGKQRPNWTTVEAIVRATGGKVTANDFLGSANARS